MKPSTTTYDTITQGLVTEPITKVAFLWPAGITGNPPVDLSRCFESITPNADMTTDMPATSRLITGYPSRSCTMTLFGAIDPSDQTKTAQGLFDPYSTASALYGQDWTGVSGPIVKVWQGLDIATQMLAANLPVDPTFETGITGWIAGGTSSSPAIASSTTHASQGTKSMMMTWAAGAPIGEYAYFPLPTVPGVDYTVLLDIWVGAGSAQIFANGLVSTPNAGTGAFETHQLTFTAIDVTTTLGVTNPSAVTAGQQVWVDNLRITQHVEVFSAFAGFVDNCAVNRASGEVTLTLRDMRGLLESVPTIPAAIASLPGSIGILPGLTNQWVVDQVLRANGIYTSPPQRTANSIFYLSGHSSLWPETGTVPSNGWLSGGTQSSTTGLWPPAAFQTNQYGTALCPTNAYITALTPSPVSINNGASVFMEALCDFSGTAAGFTALTINLETGTPASTYAAAAGVTSGEFVSVQFSHNGTNIAAAASAGRGFLGTTLVNATVSSGTTPATWHKCAVLITLLGTGAFRLDFYLDDVFQGTATSAALSTPIAAAGAQTVVVYSQSSAIEGIQITTDTAYSLVPWTIGAYLDPSLNNLTAVPPLDSTTDAWGVIQAAAGSEFAVAGFDEDTIFHYRNRNNAPTSAAATITSTTRLKDMQFEVNEANRARTVTASVKPLAASAPSLVWTATAVTSIPALGTVSVIANLPAPALFIPSGFGNIPSGGFTAFTLNGIRLARRSNGTGAGVTFGTMAITVSQISSTAVKVTFRNTNAFPVWLVSPSSFTDVAPGTPMFQLVGQTIQPIAVAGSVIDAAGNSQLVLSSTYGSGVPATQLPDNAFRQDPTSAQTTLDSLLEDLIRPRPMMTALTIIGDARLQLGDRVQLQDQGELVDGGYGPGAVLADDVILTSIRPSITPDGGFVQTCVARTWASPRQWVLGQAGKSEIGTTAWI